MCGSERSTLFDSIAYTCTHKELYGAQARGEGAESHGIGHG